MRYRVLELVARFFAPERARRALAELQSGAGNLRHRKSLEAEAAFERAKQSGFASESALERLKLSTARPIILHLDSIADGGHSSDTVIQTLRKWLRYAFGP